MHRVCMCRYVAHEMKKAIQMVGADKILLVVIDGGSDWTATETMIQEFYPWISFLHCTSHEVSLIIRDCFKEEGGIAELHELDAWMTDAQHWFSSHTYTIFRKEQALSGEKKSFVWPAVTRYCGVLLKFKRFFEMRPLLRRVVQSGVYIEKNFVDDPFPAKIIAADVWDMMERVIKTLGPLLLLCRLADGQKPVISKLYGTQLWVRKEIENACATAGPDSVEAKICAKFLARWPEMQSDIVCATYMLEPVFVDKSKTSAHCAVKLWQLARRVLRITDEQEWNTMHGRMVAQLAKFQDRGTGLTHMASPAAWTNLFSKCALQWWCEWGAEVPELQKLAMKIVPLMIGSGPAERTWKDVGQILTKNRNKLRVSTCLDLVFVRTWLRRELTLVTDEELEVFKEWEVELMRAASFYGGPADPAAVVVPQVRIFEDTFEAWEQQAIDGTGPGNRIRLGAVKRDQAARFRLQEKYKGLYFVDKDPDGDNMFYDGQGTPLPAADWENRKIVGLIWENHRGWRVETKLCFDIAGPSANYHMNPTLIRMIKDSTRNRSCRFRRDL